MEQKTAGRQATTTLWIPSGDLKLCVDEHTALGSGRPVLLLLCAAEQTAAHWPPSFLDAIVDAGVDIVAFDTRDSGRSSKIPSDVGYRLGDLVDDAVSVLDALGIERVHVFGRSMGGMVAQLLALDHPSQVESLTLMSTTPGPGSIGLSTPEDDLVEAIAERLFNGPPKEADERVEWLAEGQRLFCGQAFPFDVERERALARHDLASGHPLESGHGTAVFATKPWIDRLADLAVPTAVIHGDEDHVYGFDHAQALASRMGADVKVLAGLGHEFPPEVGAEVASVVLATMQRD
ncbi:MAG: alpha/beta hydrolase [Acidobacteria bacterium]|nr:alpha/beta hydrolase [Acidobacteriota bacterium]